MNFSPAIILGSFHRTNPTSLQELGDEKTGPNFYSTWLVSATRTDGSFNFQRIAGFD